ncbi:putative membrane protein [Brucella sp. 10RB9215]|uniref:O-antigen ligase family protein n=1 Tax=Brucella sp. 10RB9215 TaxID=1149953 RepID=UPI00090B0A31|nr:O-antigen ligase [Brucella sp. 10RB9215]SBW16158.1 putative membrane protein [Brucella sp. 10RB9215]
MSNIATRKRTERANSTTAPISRAALRRAALIVATITICILLISFHPFTPADVESDGASAAEGDIINQLGFGALGMTVIAAFAMLGEPGKLVRLVHPAWLLMFFFLIASVFVSSEPDMAVRGVIFTMIGLMCVAGVLVLPRDGDSYSSMLTITASLILTVSYLGVVFLPSLGTHGADVWEPQNSFLWRGLFSHKNVAGPVMAGFSFAGLYLWRRGWRWSGFLIGVSALIFVSQTGSKTTMALVPIAMLMVVVPGLMGLRFITVATMFFIEAAFATFTFGVVLFEPIYRFVKDMDIDPTFTGRTSIWKFALERMPGHMWTGYGYDSFWRTPMVINTARPYYLDWDVRSIVHAHNGYFDLVIQMGMPGFICGIGVIIVLPLIDYLRCKPQRENRLLADYFLMVIFFCTLNAMMESFFFRRVDPIWLTTVFGIFGLRLTATSVIPKRSI